MPRQSGWRLLHTPRVLETIQSERQRLYQTNLAKLAVSTLQHVMQDPDALAAARVSAARTSLELAGDLSDNNSDGSEGRHLSDLTPGELSSLIDKWEDARILVAKDITPAGSLHSLGD